jgi:hypothetical protein
VGFLVLLPLARRALSAAATDRRDAARRAVLRGLSCANLALTRRPRAALALGAAGHDGVVALLGVERLSARKTAVSSPSAASALGTVLAEAQAGAWRGDLIMAGATLYMALYSVRSRPFVARSSAIGFLVAGMGVGAGTITLVAAARGSFEIVGALTSVHWGALLYLGAVGGAAAFWLWSWALQHASPTRVTATMTVNPAAAGACGRAAAAARAQLGARRGGGRLARRATDARAPRGGLSAARPRRVPSKPERHDDGGEPGRVRVIWLAVRCRAGARRTR